MSTILATTTPVLIALIGFLFTYIHTRRLQRRNDRLAWLNRQLGELYGPLFTLSESARISYQTFVKRHPGAVEDGPLWDAPTREFTRDWQQWMAHAFQPTNRRMAELLLDHGDLLVDESVPVCISTFLAHVASYEVLLQAWERDESSELLAAVDYPPTFTTYVADNYGALKQRQARLIGRQTA